jgi:hypothetical protein
MFCSKIINKIMMTVACIHRCVAIRYSQNFSTTYRGNPNNLSATHVHLKDIEADNEEDALSRMRAENWSPNGEALDLLQSKGLQHTTMTIGDVLVDESDAVYLVTGIGFSLLPKHEEPRR